MDATGRRREATAPDWTAGYYLPSLPSLLTHFVCRVSLLTETMAKEGVFEPFLGAFSNQAHQEFQGSPAGLAAFSVILTAFLESPFAPAANFSAKARASSPPSALTSSGWDISQASWMFWLTRLIFLPPLATVTPRMAGPSVKRKPTNQMPDSRRAPTA